MVLIASILLKLPKVHRFFTHLMILLINTFLLLLPFYLLVLVEILSRLRAILRAAISQAYLRGAHIWGHKRCYFCRVDVA